MTENFWWEKDQAFDQHMKVNCEPYGSNLTQNRLDTDAFRPSSAVNGMERMPAFAKFRINVSCQRHCGYVFKGVKVSV
jgi:hypothetical protein